MFIASPHNYLTTDCYPNTSLSLIVEFYLAPVMIILLILLCGVWYVISDCLEIYGYKNNKITPLIFRDNKFQLEI